MSKYIKEGEVAERMAELMEPVNKQILMCDNREDVLMLACAMLTLVRSIFDQELGEDGRKKMFKDLV
jgi:hypothetical protein